MFNSFLTNISLRQKLLFSFVILVLLPLGTVSLIAYQIFRDSLFDNMSTSTTEVLRQTSIHIDRYVSQLDSLTQRPYFDQNMLKILADGKAGRLDRNTEYTFNNVAYSYDSYLSTVFQQMRLPRNDTEGIFLYPVSGSVYFSARNSAHRTDFDPSQTDWYRSAIRHKGRLVLTPSHIQEQISYSPARVFSMTRVINDFATRQPLGVLTIDFNFAELEKIRDDVKLFPGGRLGIYTGEGSPVLSGGAEQEKLVKEFLRLPHEKFRVMNGYWTAYYASAYSDWIIFYQIPVDVLNKQIDKIKTYIVLVAVCGLLLACIFYGWIVVRLTNPLLSLRKMMSRVGEGDFSVAMPQREMKDEIGQLTAYFVKVAGRLQDTIETTHVLGLKRKQAQLDALRMQINPHFLYNTLESIYMMAMMNEDEETASMIGYLGDFFKITLRQTAAFITLREEIENFGVYWELQKVRFARRIRVSVDYPPSLALAPVVPLVLQPLAENAILHGLRENAGDIAIRVFAEGKRMYMEVSDNGRGLTEDQLSALRRMVSEEPPDGRNARHTGLRNVQERIRLLCGDDYGLQFDRSPQGGLRVRIALPLQAVTMPEREAQ